MKYSFCFLLLFGLVNGYSQDIYKDSMTKYIGNYVQQHEVVKGDDKKFFRFYPINARFLVTARFEKIDDGKWFSMETSGTLKKTFRVYGIAHFNINDTAVKLTIYQSQNLMNVEEYKNHLFLPFTDLSSGEETYTAGRYLDLSINDIRDGKLLLDFNKAYNPYCAYVSGKYNCPIPPAENRLNVTIAAGEKLFLRPH